MSKGSNKLLSLESLFRLTIQAQNTQESFFIKKLTAFEIVFAKSRYFHAFQLY